MMEMGKGITRTCFLVVMVFGASYIKAQKYDYRWILGHLGYTIDVVFTENSADTIRTARPWYMDNAQTTISDSGGTQLLFYTNGAKIFAANDSIMLNGDSINYGPEWETTFGTGYNWGEAITGLPTASPDVWNVFHYYIEYNSNSELIKYPWRVYQTRIDMSGDNGKGQVLFKNRTLVQDTLGSYVSACKHANGRDWWLLASKTSSNCLYTFLTLPDTVIQYPTQCLGGNYLSSDAGQAYFSPDGSKFGVCTNESGILLYDFDRCTGELSNPVTLPFYRTFGNGVLQYGLSFSPNSRFLYVAQTRYVLQFDTWDSNIAASVDTVGYYQPPPDTLSFPGTFFLMQLAPDGKIYLSANNSIKWLHVIGEPDKKGDSCNFVNYGFRLPYGNSFGLPKYPNYRLGALTGSGCDTLHVGVKDKARQESNLKVFPNPRQRLCCYRLWLQ